jgi:hypothetical protein
VKKIMSVRFDTRVRTATDRHFQLGALVTKHSFRTDKFSQPDNDRMQITETHTGSIARGTVSQQTNGKAVCALRGGKTLSCRDCCCESEGCPSHVGLPKQSVKQTGHIITQQHTASHSITIPNTAQQDAADTDSSACLACDVRVLGTDKPNFQIRIAVARARPGKQQKQSV